MNSLDTKAPKPPPLKNQVKITSGPTADKLTNKTILEIDLTKVSTAEDLRKAITADGFMQNGDAFLLPPDNFTLAKSAEASLPWTKLKEERTEIIGIISQPPKKKENLAVPTLPETTKSWEPKIGGGLLLPDLPTTKIAENNQVVPLVHAVDLDPTPKPLTACFVDVHTIVSDAGSGADMDLAVGGPPSFPPTQPGSSPWCWVGQTFQPGQSKTKKILIVRENIKGAFGPMKGTAMNWSKDNKYYIGTPIPVDPINYVALGSYFSQHAQLKGGPEPNWTEPKYKWDQLVAVRRDLCVQAQYSDSFWNDAGAGEHVQDGSVWEIVPKDGNGLALELFGGSNLTGHDKPTRTPWTIRSDVVEWVTWN